MSGPLLHPGMMMAGGIDTGDEITNSLICDTAYGNTHASGWSRTTWTCSFWVKRSASLSASNIILDMQNGASDTATQRMYFYSDDTFRLEGYASSWFYTTQKFRDTTAWYHIVVQQDTTAGTAADRHRLWVNGVELTAANGGITQVTPGASANTGFGTALAHATFGNAGSYLYGYVSDFYMLDGVTATASDFGEFNAEGHWIPKAYSGSYGTGGWHWDFTVAPGTGNGAHTDASGNGNHGSDVSGFASTDQRTDTPTNNCATMNALDQATTAATTFNDGALKVSGPSTGWRTQGATMWANKGKWYFEAEVTGYAVEDQVVLGWCMANHAMNTYPGGDNFGWGVNWNSSNTNINLQYGASATPMTTTGNLSTTDVIMCAIDIDNELIWFGVNGTWFDMDGAGTGVPSTGTNGHTISGASDLPGRPCGGTYTASDILTFRFNADDLSYTPPTGFNTFQVSALSDGEYATIPKGSDYFDILTYTGDGTAIGSGGQPVTGLDFSPDLVWIKNRDAADDHNLFDTVRGATNRLYSNLADAESSVAESLASFDSGGFTVGSNVQVNTSSENYVAWCWKKAIKAGFNISEHVGTGAAVTGAHGLGVAPDAHMTKNRDTGANNWGNYFATTLNSSSVQVTDPETDYLLLSLTNALTDTAAAWNDTAPDATSVTYGTSFSVSADNYIDYAWEEVPGFSRFGAYVGNGNADGPFVWCGFRPRLIITKRTDSTGDWYMYDSERDSTNPNDTLLRADTTGVETNSNDIDFLANGFKFRTTVAASNASGGEYIFLAFAEHPFKYARAF